MSSPISKENAEHYKWGDGCDGWHLVRSDNLSVIQEFIPPGKSEVRHYHAKCQQFFYVLSGELTFEIGGETHVITPRRGIEVSPSVPHQASNAGACDVEFLVISQPATRGDKTQLSSD